ncbi:hypothetical protein FOA43_003759 [Brettanomyces nanus]|uniref:Major facilitator superfamily (MFS) profile domain-containing protein n=1 Tax=Eeniella nana TaxID=13502 RepID=A0A875S3X6_EENNA|nr:uncharacterized protein FOA43_003759 [Brettanomyces nanus]QPG76371.1 hypothetical protein FOA43_003759 [Brettanomyces nanus]
MVKDKGVLNESSPLLFKGGSSECTTTIIQSHDSVETPTIPREEEVIIPDNVWYIIISLWTSSFLSAADTTIVSTTANVIASSMNGSDKIAWIATSYLLTNAVFQPLVGKISDVYGRRTTLLVSQVWFILGCLLCALSRTVNDFIVARAIAGVGGGGMSALSSIIVTDVIPLRKRGFFQGYANLVYGTGQFLGPIIGSIFLTANEKAGWRWMFGLQVPLVSITSVLVFKNVHEFRFDAELLMKNRFRLSNIKKIDLPGSLSLAGFIVAILILFSASSTFQVEAAVLCAVLSAISFYLVENYVVEERIIPPRAFQGLLRIAALIAFFGTMAMYSLNFVLPLYVQIIQDFSSFQLGVFNAFGVFSSAAGSLIAGWILKEKEKVRPEIVVKKSVNISIGSCLLSFAGAFICMFFVRAVKPTIDRADINYLKMAIIALGYTLTSLGYGSFLVSLLVLVVGEVGMRHQATVTGMNYMFRSMGSVGGVGISLGVYNLMLRKELYHYFVTKGREHGFSIYHKLLKDSFYIRNGLPQIYVHKVLKFYRESLGDSLVLVFIMGSLALILSLLMRLYNPHIGRHWTIV